MSVQANTKVERVVEGVESLAQAIVANHAAVDQHSLQATFQNVAIARDELRDALAELLKPVLRSIRGGLSGETGAP